MKYHAWLAFAVFACSVSAQDSSDDSFRDVLQKTVVNRVDTELKRIALLRLIHTQQDWQAAKDAGTKLDGVFDGIPVDATSNYDDEFERYQSSASRRDELNLQDDQAHALATSFLPKDAISAWAQCMQHYRDQRRLSVGVEDIQPCVHGQEGSVTLRIHWDPPPVAFNQKAVESDGNMWAHIHVVLLKSYQGNWHDGDSFGRDDLPLGARLAAAAHSQIINELAKRPEAQAAKRIAGGETRRSSGATAVNGLNRSAIGGRSAT